MAISAGHESPDDGLGMGVSVMAPLDSSQPDETIHFGIDGADFELSLSKAQAEELRGTLQPYIKVARKIGYKRNGQRRASAGVAQY
jgi:hypothetical protein